MNFRLTGQSARLLRNIAITSNSHIINKDVLITRNLRIRDSTRKDASLILATVTLTSKTNVIVIRRRVLKRLNLSLRNLIPRLLKRKRRNNLRKHRNKVRPRCRTNIILLHIRRLFIVNIARSKRRHTLRTRTKLRRMKSGILANLLIGMNRVLTKNILILNRIVINTINRTPRLTPTRKRRRLRINNHLKVRTRLLQIVIARASIFILRTSNRRPIITRFPPMERPLRVHTKLTRGFRLRLLGLPRTRGGITKNSLITRKFASLTSTRKRLTTNETLSVRRINRSTLNNLKARVRDILNILNSALRNLRRRIRLASINRIILTTNKTKSILLLRRNLRLLVKRNISKLLRLVTNLNAPILSSFINTRTLLSLLAIRRQIKRTNRITTNPPNLKVRRSNNIRTRIMKVFLRGLLPPHLFTIIFRLRARQTVIPNINRTAMGLKTKRGVTTPFARNSSFIRNFFNIFRKVPPRGSLRCGVSVFWCKLRRGSAVVNTS